MEVRLGGRGRLWNHLGLLFEITCTDISAGQNLRGDQIGHIGKVSEIIILSHCVKEMAVVLR